MLYYNNNWFSERSKLDAQMSEKDIINCKKDSTFFAFGKPNAGWIEMKVFVNGEQKLIGLLSTVYDPFTEIKHWLEDIVKEDLLEHTLRIECEGSALFFHYENLYCAEVGVSFVGEERTTIDFNAFTNQGIGLFYIYDSSNNTMSVQAICYTKEFVKSMYLAMLYMCNCSKDIREVFIKEWYYLENEDSQPSNVLDNWTMYNTIKSPLIEWDLQSDECYRHKRPNFIETLLVNERVHMWAEYGDALFWTTGGCCGTADEFYTEKHGTISLKEIEGIREWYDEWDENPSYAWPEEKCKAHRARGFELAKKVRAILPDTLDLYYDFWYPAIKTVNNQYGISESLPVIVFNQKLFKN